MARFAAFLSLALAASGLLSLAGCAEEAPRTGVVDGGETVVVAHEGREIHGDLEIREGGTLRLENAILRVFGSVVVRGQLEMTGSRIHIEKEGQPRAFNVWGGNVSAWSSDIVKADAIDVRDGRFSLNEGVMLFGRLVSRGSSVISLNGIQVDASGETHGSYGGDATVQLDGESFLNVTSSELPVTYYVSAHSRARFLNTGVGLSSLGGPGLKEVAYTLHVYVQDREGQPIPNATVAVQSVALGVVEDEGRTDWRGYVQLEQLLLDATTVVRPHDPHAILVNAMPLAASIAYTGESTATVMVP